MGLSEWWARATGTPVAEAKKKTGPAEPPKDVERAGFEWGIGPSGLNEWSSTPGAGVDRRTQLTELYDAYLACPWAWAAVNAIARRVTAGGLEFAWTDPEGDGDAEQPEKPAEVQACERLFRFVNERENMRQLLRGIITDLLVFGDAFVEVVWIGKVPVALYSLDCPSTTPLADDHGKITGYVQVTDYGQRAEFEPHQILHFSLDSPRSGVFGVSPIQAALLPIQRWLFAAATQLQMFRRGDPLRLHVDLPASMSPGGVKKWLAYFQSTNVGPDNVANPVVTKGGGVVNELQRGAVDSQAKVMTTARDEILSTLGCPPAQAGVIESGNIGGGTGEAQDRTFQVQTCDPIGAILVDIFQFAIAVRGFNVPEGWGLQLQEVDLRDSKVIEDIREQRYRNGAYTLNDWRTDIGKGSVDGGDEPLLLVASGTVARVRDLEASAIAGIAKQVQGTQIEIVSLGGDDTAVELGITEDPPPGDEAPGGPDGWADDWDDDGGEGADEPEEEPEEGLAALMADAGVAEFYDDHNTRWVWDVEEARYVRTAAGARRYGLPIGSEIRPRRNRDGYFDDDQVARRRAYYANARKRAQARHAAKHPDRLDALPRFDDDAPDLSKVPNLTDAGLATELAAAETRLHQVDRNSLRHHDAKLAVDVLRTEQRVRDAATTTTTVPDRSSPLPAGVTVTTHHSGRLHVTSPYDKAFVAAVKDLGGRWSAKSRTWSVGAEHADKLDELLRGTYGDAPSVPATDLPDTVTIRVRPNGKTEVRSPFHEGFVAEARQIGGAWDPSAKAWVFPPHRDKAARAAAARHYTREWQARQDEARKAEKAARDAEREANRQASARAGATPKQQDLLRRLALRVRPSDWHDIFDGAGGPAGQYQPGGPTSAQIEAWVGALNQSSASAMIDELIAWRKGY